MKSKQQQLILGILIGLALLGHTDSQAQSGTWISASDGNWTNTTNWKDGIIADGAGNTATFVTNLTADRTITLGTTTRTIGHLAFTNLNATARIWTVSSSSGTQWLTYDAGGSGTGTSQVDVAALTTFNSGFFRGSNTVCKTGPGTWSLATTNSSFSSPLVVAEGTLSLLQVDAAKSIPIRLDSADKNSTLSIGSPSDGATFAMGSLQVLNSGTGLVTLAKPTGGTRSVLPVSPVINKAIDIYVGQGNFQLSGSISGEGSVRKTGSGGLYYFTTMSYTGGTTIRQGYIWLIYNGTGSVIPSGKTVVLGDELTGNSGV